MPRQLPIRGRVASFATLVKEFAGDVPPRALLEELRQLRVVRESALGVELVGNGRTSFRAANRCIERMTRSLENELKIMETPGI